MVNPLAPETDLRTSSLTADATLTERAKRFDVHAKMIDSRHQRSLTQQARTVGTSCGRVYDLPRPVSATDLASMRWIDRVWLG